jgi:hypothetical protein
MSLEQIAAVLVYQGEDRNLNFRLADQNTGDSFDLTGATEIDVVFPTVTNITYPNGCLHKKLSLSQVTIINAGGGKFSVALTATDTNAILVSDAVAVEIRVTIAGFLTVVQIPEAFSLQPSLFPNC